MIRSQVRDFTKVLGYKSIMVNKKWIESPMLNINIWFYNTGTRLRNNGFALVLSNCTKTKKAGIQNLKTFRTSSGLCIDFRLNVPHKEDEIRKIYYE